MSFYFFFRLAGNFCFMILMVWLLHHTTFTTY
nr:MAG TPA: hypothetical protein [Caudoviricetes sp.]